MGLRIWAPSPAQLIPPAAEAFYAAIGNLHGGPVSEMANLEFQGGDAETLLRDYLTRLLVEFERNRRILTQPAAVQFDGQVLRVAGEWAVLDEAASECLREVKAVTYHELSIREVAGGVEARVIVDI
ncbi:MAG: archease [Phycisphaerales bacterium]|nr:archease [Phycisphaerales bacterium]